MRGMLEILKLGVIAYALGVMMQPNMVLNWYYRLIDRIPYDFIFKPLGGCNICLSGQIALWFYLITYWKEYNLFEHIFYVCGTITITLILDKLIDYEPA